jgi:hypothetical protein
MPSSALFIQDVVLPDGRILHYWARGPVGERIARTAAGRAAIQADVTALDQLRTRLPESRGYAELRKAARTAIYLWSGRAARSDPERGRRFLQLAVRVRDDLLSDGASPLEELLVEEIIACWLALEDAHLSYIMEMTTHNDLQSADARRRQLDSAQRRYLRAIKTLAEVRRLEVPAIIGQLNLAGQQVHLATSAPPQQPLPHLPEDHIAPGIQPEEDQSLHDEGRRADRLNNRPAKQVGDRKRRDHGE